MENLLKETKNAALKLANLDNKTKNEALEAIAQIIEKNKDVIFENNNMDLVQAKELVSLGKITQSTYNRLKLDENKMRDMIAGIYDVIKLEDPVNKILSKTKLDENLILEKISCPIGVICVIFEARPDVIVQIATLAIKSGNAVVLKGGSESINTNKIFAKLINEALESINFPKNVINLVFSHDDVNKLLNYDKYVNLIIPRGSNKLVKYIKENTKIPVLGHASGICHIFVDESANLNKTLKICVDSKTQYPSACNSVETILVHKNFKYIDKLKDCLKTNDVEIFENVDDYSFEYGEKKVTLKIVSNLDEAINHINNYGSGHTDCIITEDENNANKFLNEVDSSSVYHNCSTRFADGFRYGFGAEVGISTNKTHARGPVGLEGLTIYKYKLKGNGQIVDDYAKGLKTFKHEKL